jgi:hypothetical protein
MYYSPKASFKSYLKFESYFSSRNKLRVVHNTDIHNCISDASGLTFYFLGFICPYGLSITLAWLHLLSLNLYDCEVLFLIIFRCYSLLSSFWFTSTLLLCRFHLSNLNLHDCEVHIEIRDHLQMLRVCCPVSGWHPHGCCVVAKMLTHLAMSMYAAMVFSCIIL